jgi:mono/diheme cytochrome c family protein
LIEPSCREGHDSGRVAVNKKLRASAPAVCSFPERSSVAAIALALLFSTHALAVTAPQIYKTKCSACHGAKGAGDTMLGRNLNLRPLASAEVQKQSDDELFTLISKGKKKRMPSFENKLSKDQIDDLVKYIRSLKQ